MEKYQISSLTVLKFVTRTRWVVSGHWTFEISCFSHFRLLNIFHIRHPTFQYQNQWHDQQPPAFACEPQISPICYHSDAGKFRFCIFIADLDSKCDSSCHFAGISRWFSSTLLYHFVSIFQKSWKAEKKNKNNLSKKENVKLHQEDIWRHLKFLCCSMNWDLLLSTKVINCWCHGKRKQQQQLKLS